MVPGQREWHSRLGLGDRRHPRRELRWCAGCDAAYAHSAAGDDRGFAVYPHAVADANRHRHADGELAAIRSELAGLRAMLERIESRMPQ